MDILEESLKRAMDDPKARREFYWTLLESQLFIPHGNSPEEIKIEDGRLAVGVQLKLPSIPADGHNWIPVFSSQENLSKAITEQKRYIRLRGRDFFELVPGAYVVLNPGGFGKQLLPDEIAAMLSADIFKEDFGQGMKTIKTQKPEKILLGQPQNYPHKLIEALKAHFANDVRVKRAFLAHGLIPSQSAEPQTLIGVEADDYAGVMRSIEPHLREVASNEVVYFVPIEKGHVVAEYMVKDTKPFYIASNLGTSSAPKPSIWKRILGK